MHRPLVKARSLRSQNPPPHGEVMSDHQDKSHMGKSVMQAAVGRTKDCPRLMLFLSLLPFLSQGREHIAGVVCSFIEQTDSSPLHRAARAHRSCLLNLSFFRTAECVFGHRAGQDTRLSSRDET